MSNFKVDNLVGNTWNGVDLLSALEALASLHGKSLKDLGFEATIVGNTTKGINYPTTALEIPTSVDGKMNLGDNFTIELNFKHTLGDNDYVILSDYNNNAKGSHFCQYDNTKKKLRVYTDTTPFYIDVELEENKIYNWVHVKEGDNNKIYIDNTLITTFTSNIYNNTTLDSFYIGSKSDGSQEFKGELYFVRITNDIIFDEDLNKLDNYSNPDNLVYQYGELVSNSTSNSNNKLLSVQLNEKILLENIDKSNFTFKLKIPEQIFEADTWKKRIVGINLDSTDDALVFEPDVMQLKINGAVLKTIEYDISYKIQLITTNDSTEVYIDNKLIHTSTTPLSIDEAWYFGTDFNNRSLKAELEIIK